MPSLARLARLSGHDTRERIGQIGVPTMVLVGERDIVNPPKVSGELASGLRRRTTDRFARCWPSAPR